MQKAARMCMLLKMHIRAAFNYVIIHHFLWRTAGPDFSD